MFKIKIGDNILSIDVTEPEEGNKLIMSNEDRALLAKIATLHGFRGIGISPNSLCPLDFARGLNVAKIDFEVIEGQEILDKFVNEPNPDIIW